MMNSSVPRSLVPSPLGQLFANQVLRRHLLVTRRRMNNRSNVGRSPARAQTGFALGLWMESLAGCIAW